MIPWIVQVTFWLIIEILMLGLFAGFVFFLVLYLMDRFPEARIKRILWDFWGPEKRK